MDYITKRVDIDNYNKFEDMIFWRENGFEGKRRDKVLDVRIENELENPNLYIFAAEYENRFIGWISLVYIPKIGNRGGHGHIYVDELWVAESYRNNGIATELLKKADLLKTELEAKGIRLYCNMDNPVALNLYKKCGYTESGSAYFMEK